ncbi:hypothetical protein ACWEKT_08430 [Nocardia takedensis]
MTGAIRLDAAPDNGRDLDGWLRALDRFVAVPAAFAEPRLTRHQALEMLRCGDEVLDRLVAGGLPAAGTGEDRRFDWYDLFNLGLYSGTGRSQAELAFGFGVRWMSAPISTWTEEREWDVRLTLGCGRPRCGPEPVWRIAVPRPEINGGSILDSEVLPARPVTRAGMYESRAPQAPQVHVRVRTRGEHRRLLAAGATEIVREFIARDLRWVRMPERMQADPGAVHALGVANCISAGLELAQLMTAAGYQARTRRGWLLGVMDIEHAWVEVLDDDGVVKAVDPVFALLGRFVPDAPPDFADACLGSRLNRLLPTDLRADQPLVQHECDGAGAPVERRVAIRAVPRERRHRVV